METDSINNINDSFETENINNRVNLDVYEKSLEKLAHENKILRRRVAKLTDLARTKEQQLIESFNQACDLKRKYEEINQIEHNTQLQSYYECFLQIEKENNSLKSKIEQMHQKIKEQQEKIDNFIPEKSIDNDVSSNEHELNQKSTNNQYDSELNSLSKKHINEEMDKVNRQTSNLVSSKINNEFQFGNENLNFTQHQGNLSLKQQRINELEIELDSLNSKLKNIEACLARWIFRACDYKLDLDKFKEKSETFEQQRLELEKTRNKLTETLEKVETLANELEISKTRQASYKNQETLTDTLIMKTELIQTDTITKNDYSIQTDPQNAESQISGNKSVTIKSSSSLTITGSATSHELTLLRTRMDSLILEKNSLRARNEELIQELNSISIKPSFSQLNKKSLVENKACQTAKSSFNHALVQTEVQFEKNNIVEKIHKTDETMEHNNDRLWKEWDLARIKLEKKLNEERMTNVKISQDFDNLKSNFETERIEWDNQMKKLLREFNQNKQISDTIINQQKKLLDFLQDRIREDESVNSHHNIINIFNKKKSQKTVFNQNQLLSNQQKTQNNMYVLKKQDLNKKGASQEKSYSNHEMNDERGKNLISNSHKFKSEVKINQIMTELNSHYQTYSDVYSKQQTRQISTDINAKPNAIEIDSFLNNYDGNHHLKQIHVFITGLNTSPTYCHVCQQIIPLIAYASKCQLCSFTCHSTCSSPLDGSISSGRKFNTLSVLKNSPSANFNQNYQKNSNINDPLKYCGPSLIFSPLISFQYSSYINKLIAFDQLSFQNCDRTVSIKSSNILLSDYVYLDNNSKWKKVWLCLRIDEKHQEAKLEIFQSKNNLKPFDTINLISDRIQIESNAKKIQKLTSSAYLNGPSISQSSSTSETYLTIAENIYEEVSDVIVNVKTNNELALPDFESSSLVLLIFNNISANNSNRIMVKIGFLTFNEKNIWYDALLSSILVNSKIPLNISGYTNLVKKIPTQSATTNSILNDSANDKFKLMNYQKVLKPFLELYDTVVNCYCFINEDLLALACDDGLYALNYGPNGKNSANNVSLVKIDSVESAHKLYYESEFGKICFIGRKSRQFLSIDVNELNACLINNIYKNTNNVRESQMSENDFEQTDVDEEARSIEISMENVHQIDRCHLFECRFNEKSGQWFLAVATPESIYLLNYNKLNNKYTLLKSIQTQTESPCICMKFTRNFSINQLLYSCGKEFYRMDLLSATFSVTPIVPETQLNDSSSTPIAICVVSSPPSLTYPHQEAILLCYSTYGLFLVYNFLTQNWQLSGISSSKKSTSSSLNVAASQVDLNPIHVSQSVLKWPRGSSLTPLQIEFDSSYLYLFYNDCIIVYQVSFENDLSLNVRKYGINFVYKPRFLSTFSNKTSNCVIISNKRLVEEQQSQQLQQDLLDKEAYEEKEIKGTLDPVLQDLNDKICLSYFSPASN